MSMGCCRPFAGCMCLLTTAAVTKWLIAKTAKTLKQEKTND